MIPISDIIAAASALTLYRQSQIRGHEGRERPLSRVRQAVCLVAYEQGHSFSEIGFRMDDRDHSSITYCVNTARDRRKLDRLFAELCARIQMLAKTMKEARERRDLTAA